jgi:hypothetical protein
MKKLFTFALVLASFGFFGAGSATTVNAKTLHPQFRIQIGTQRQRRNRDWNRGRDWNSGERVGYGYGRSVIQTRVVQRGWHTYRETYRVTYLPDGETQTTLISRVRVDY